MQNLAKNNEPRHAASIFNTHLNKGGAGKIDAMMRVMGSVAWVNAVRAAHLFAADPDVPEKVFFVPMKMNLCKKRKGLSYQIAVSGELAKVEWLGEVDTTANEAVSGQYRQKSRKESAAEWLVEKFREKLVWPSDDLFKDAAMNGISRNAMFEAKTALELPPCRKTIMPNGVSVWTWWVPENWAGFVSTVPTEKNVGTLGTLGTVETEGIDF